MRLALTWNGRRWAATGNETGVAAMLEEGADVNFVNADGQTALHWV